MAGYNPASTLITNLPQAQATYFDKDFVQNLKANTPFLRVIDRRELPAQSGNQHKLYMYNPFAANVSAQTEGTVGDGITPSVETTSATIGQYADYVNVSDIALETAIDPALENLEREMAYRLALTLSTLVRNTADGANSVDSSVLIDTLATDKLTYGRLVSATQALQGRNVKPFDTAAGRFVGVIHPFCIGDILNDSGNNSLADLLKRTSEGFDRLAELPGEDEVQVLDFGGMRFYESSLVKQTPNFKTSGNTAFRTYLFGNQAVIGISLGVKENAQIANGDFNNMKVWITKYDQSSVSDPSRVIGGSVAYNAKFVATLPPDTVGRLRVIDTVSAIS